MVGYLRVHESIKSHGVSSLDAGMIIPSSPNFIARHRRKCLSNPNRKLSV